MEKKYQLPLQIFMILEKANAIIYTAETLINNHYIVYIDKKNFNFLNIILKNEFFCGKSILVEASAVDILNYNNLNNEIPIFTKKNRILPYYIYYLYTIKTRLTVIIHDESENSKELKSIDNIYKNANWLERELSEMYGVFFKKKKDSRKLLLDYTKDDNPMLKDYPCDGYTETFYDFFEEQIISERLTTVEL